jgi:hypothetical protein
LLSWALLVFVLVVVVAEAMVATSNNPTRIPAH